jgi:hypothetical protein
LPTSDCPSKIPSDGAAVCDRSGAEGPRRRIAITPEEQNRPAELPRIKRLPCVFEPHRALQNPACCGLHI